MKVLRREVKKKRLRVIVSPKTLFTHARYKEPEKVSKRRKYGSLSTNT